MKDKVKILCVVEPTGEYNTHQYKAFSPMLDDICTYGHSIDEAIENFKAVLKIKSVQLKKVYTRWIKVRLSNNP